MKSRDSDDRRYQPLPNGVISNHGSVVSHYLASSSIGRLYPHPFPQNSSLARGDHRRTFATVGRTDSSGHLSPGTNQNNSGNKIRYGSRKILANRSTYHVSEHDTRCSDSDAICPESHFSSLLRRTLSASGLAGKFQANSGKIRTGNASSIISPGMISLQNASSTGLKVTANKSPLGLSVISGPAPISYKSITKTAGHTGNIGR